MIRPLMNRKDRKRNVEEKIDYPLKGATHPAVLNHHQVMKELKHNETRFGVRDLVSMLDDPSRGYFTQNYLPELSGIFPNSRKDKKSGKGKYGKHDEFHQPLI